MKCANMKQMYLYSILSKKKKIRFEAKEKQNTRQIVSPQSPTICNHIKKNHRLTLNVAISSLDKVAIIFHRKTPTKIEKDLSLR